MMNLAQLRWRNYKKPQRTCILCGTSFTCSPSDLKRGGNLCSRPCANKYASAKRWASHKKQILFKNCEVCNALFSYKAYRHQTAKYCSTKCQHQGMITTEKYLAYRQNYKYLYWVAFVKRRAGFKCELCKASKKLHAHHIVPVSVDPSKCYNKDNGKCLCFNCHKETHRLMRLAILSQAAEGYGSAEGATTREVRPNNNLPHERPTPCTGEQIV